MKSFVRFVAEHGFILAAGIAALIHSIWSLDVAFAGLEANIATDPVNAIFRKFVAFLIAFAIDVGQISTASEIKKGHKSKSKYLTFFSFAFATYLLQFFYMSHHTPDLALSQGIRTEWVWIVKLISDASIWIVPALLPMSTLLYTFSQQTGQHEIELQTREEQYRKQDSEYARRKNELEAQAHQAFERMDAEYKNKMKELSGGIGGGNGEPPKYKLIGGSGVTVSCPNCDWKRSYSDPVQAQAGLKGHAPYCKANANVLAGRE